MAQQLKRWESPRRKGRNHKGRGGSAKQRQYKKRQKLLMKRLQKGIEGSPQANTPSKSSTPKISLKSQFKGSAKTKTSDYKREACQLPFLCLNYVRMMDTPLVYLSKREGSHPSYLSDDVFYGQ